MGLPTETWPLDGRDHLLFFEWRRERPATLLLCMMVDSIQLKTIIGLAFSLHLRKDSFIERPGVCQVTFVVNCDVPPLHAGLLPASRILGRVFLFLTYMTEGGVAVYTADVITVYAIRTPRSLFSETPSHYVNLAAYRLMTRHVRFHKTGCTSCQSSC